MGAVVKPEDHLYQEIGNQKWFTSLWAWFRALGVEKRFELEFTAKPEASVLESLPQQRSPLVSLASQLSGLYREFRNPREPIAVSATLDPGALESLIEDPSPFESIRLQLAEVLRDLIHPSSLETTAARVEVPPIWSSHRMGLPSSLSIGGHLLFIILLLSGFTISSSPEITITETFIPLYLPSDLIELPQDDGTSGGGGGGGRETLAPPSLGDPPRAAEEQLVPPAAEPPVNLDPLLVAEPTIVAPQLATMLPVTFQELGDPMAGIPSPPSSGPGVGGGIGTGQGRGVGEGEGPGLGPGEGGGFGGGVFEVGGGVSPPEILFRRAPIYSEDARKAQYEGTVVLEAIVRKDGSVEILRVLQGLGLGLDENAVEALKEWKFRPGMRQGVPVDVAVNIEVNFTLR